MGFYDRMIKQLFERCPRLVIRIINAMFKTKYKDKAEIIYLNREQVDEHETYMDMIIMIEGVKYHIEFQLLEDEMAIRMFEYGMKEALKELRKITPDDRYRLVVDMPEQAVIYLSGKNEKDKITIVLRLPDKTEVRYEVPCVSASESVEDLSDKGMYILLPFQQVRLNDAMNKAKEKKEETKKKLANEMFATHEKVRIWLNNLKEKGIITNSEFEELVTTFSDVEGYLLEKDRTVKKEVENMGDKDYVTRSDRARAEGREEGMEKGEMLRLIKMVCKKLAKGKETDEIAEDLDEDLDVIEDIVMLAKDEAPEYDCEKIYEKMKQLQNV